MPFLQKVKTDRYWQLVLMALSVSFIVHAANRNNHFQEMDSDWPYVALKQWPDMAYNYMGWWRDQGLGPVGEAGAKAIVADREKVRKLRREGPLRGIPDDQLEQELAKMSQPKIDRLARLNQVAAKKREGALKGFYALPFTTTYSPGHGLIYGLIYKQDQTIDEFNSTAMLVTLLLFHLSVWWLWLTLLRMGVSPWASAIGAFLFLFSISNYSYGYHLGSVTWNTASIALWLYLLARWYPLKRPRRLLYLGLAAFALFFFNYLFVVYYLAGMVAIEASGLVAWLVRTKQKPAVWHKMAATQLPALLGLAALLFYFLQPGQGNRGSVSGLAEAGEFTYYILLNFFAFVTGPDWINAIQAVIGGVLVLAGLMAPIVRSRSLRFDLPRPVLGAMILAVLLAGGAVALGIMTLLGAAALFLLVADASYSWHRTIAAGWNPGIGTLLRKASIYAILVYFVFVGLGQLGYAPTRHLLFLSPSIFILAALGTELILGYVKSQSFYLMKAGAVALLGFVCLFVRLPKAADKTAEVDFMGNNIHEVIVAERFVVRDHLGLPPNVPVSGGFPRGGISPQKNYFYLSQSVPFDKTVESWKLQENGLALNVLHQQVDSQQVYFTAFNPRPEEYKFTRPNALYAAIFRFVPQPRRQEGQGE